MIFSLSIVCLFEYIVQYICAVHTKQSPSLAFAPG